MDQVPLRAAQLRELAKQGKDVTITAVHLELGMVYVQETKYLDRPGKWMLPSGKWRED